MLNEHNPGLRLDSRGVLWDDCAGGGSRPVGRTTEGRLYYFRLSCGRHFHLRTPHGVRAAERLLCAWCEPPPRLKTARVRQPTELERAMHAALEGARLAALCVRETVPWWHGALDFWFPRPGLAVQVDGPRHFVARPRIPLERQQATIDIAMCAAAWSAGAGVVRVHHLQAGSAEAAADVSFALQLRAAWPAAPLLILTPGFVPIEGATIAGERDRRAFMRALEAKLQTPCRQLPAGRLLFFEAPPQAPQPL